MRPRRAEQRHDAIALYLVDDAVVAMNGILHESEHGLQTPHAEFGVAQAIDQAGRIADVGEQHREAFALSALAAERAQHALRRWIGTRRRCRRQRGAAFSAKAAGRSVDVIADVAFDAQRRAAAFAIVVAGLVVASAPRALHNKPLEPPRKRVSPQDEHRLMLRTIARFHSEHGNFAAHAEIATRQVCALNFGARS